MKAAAVSFCTLVLWKTTTLVSSFTSSSSLDLSHAPRRPYYHNDWNTQRQIIPSHLFILQRRGQPLFSDWKDQSQDSNQWWSNNGNDNDDDNTKNEKSSSKEEEDDWQTVLSRKQDGSFWSSFEPTPPTTEETTSSLLSSSSSSSSSSSLNNINNNNIEQEETEAWLDTLASLSAQEIEFNIKEADRADKVRQMEEWGFDAAIIASTLGVATDTALEDVDDVDANMKTYRQSAYRRLDLEDIDLTNVESHAMVEKDMDTDEPIRSQMVYVDEHTCIGCTHCATTAQSTFFMHQEHGRARVFQQWGDDDETIQIAIETCPVDCIHYVPYDELVQLEVERRNQNINFKARLVSQSEGGGMNAMSHRVGGANAYTPPQRISGNMKPRCTNCPSRGCVNCPMYGIGKNPEFQKKEEARKEKVARRRLEEQRERESKRVDL